jgi:hypothetical protein
VTKQNLRTEQEIFDELASLCAMPGYAHAVAFLCFRDNVVGYKDELKGEDYSKLFSPDRLIRTELSTLIGLMARVPLDLTLPSPQQRQIFIGKSDALLKELHEAMSRPFMVTFQAALADKNADPFNSAEAMREPIFYGAESAYSFQYRDLAPKRYSRDEEWLRKHKGFSSEEGRRAIVAISAFLNQKLLSTLKGLKDISRDAWSMLDGFVFSSSDIVKRSRLSSETVTAFLDAFSFHNDGNPAFTALHEFNSTNAYPILKLGEDRYILFQYVSLTEAFYDTPFYWMAADKNYVEAVMANRGKFTENFACRPARAGLWIRQGVSQR